MNRSEFESASLKALCNFLCEGALKQEHFLEIESNSLERILQYCGRVFGDSGCIRDWGLLKAVLKERILLGEYALFL